MKVVMRCKCTGMFFIKPIGCNCGWSSMDINKATRYEDTDAFRKQMQNTFGFEIEFLTV
jgi:hypothetical protein